MASVEARERWAQRPIVGRVAETSPGTQAVKGLIPKREGQAYRPDRLSGIKGRAEARLLTRIRRKARKATLARQAWLGQVPVSPRTIRQKDARPDPRRLLDARPGAGVGKPRRMPEPVLVTLPITRVGDRRREGRIAETGPPDVRRDVARGYRNGPTLARLDGPADEDILTAFIRKGGPLRASRRATLSRAKAR